MKPGWGPAGLTAFVLVGLSFLPERGRELLRLEPDRWWEPWRLLSAHWVHAGWQHAALNAATAVLFAAGLPIVRPARRWWPVLVGASLGVDLGVFALHPQVPWYVGFSGVVYGILAGGAALELRWGSRRWGGLILLGLGVKLVHDALWGTNPAVEAWVGTSVLSEAHIYGSAAGLLGGLLLPGAARSRGLG